jgi:hypothetical protein
MGKTVKFISVLFLLNAGLGMHGYASSLHDFESVEEIVERYIQASGGPALAEVKAETRKGTLLRGVSGKIPLDVIAEIPGKWRYSQTFAWGDRVCYGTDGFEAWVQDTKGISEMDAQQHLDFQLMFDIRVPLRIRDFFPEMTIKGSEKIGEKEATTILAKSQQGFMTELAFERESGLLARAGNIVFKDYRSVGNVKRPFRILLGKTQGEQHRQMIMEFTEIRHTDDMDDVLFQKPNCILASAEPPLYKRRKQVKVGLEALEACVGVYQHTDNPNVRFRVTRQKSHLIIKGTYWGQGFEIKPESETDYFIGFLGWEFHFEKDKTGEVSHLEINAGQKIKARKISGK